MSLEPLLSGAEPPGRYRFAGPQSLSELRAEAGRAAWISGVVDGRGMNDRMDLFDQFGSVLEFPSWFGGNWDAFADCLQDLSWLPASGYVVLWRRRSAGDRSLAAQADEVIDQAIDERVAMRLPPLYVVYAGPRNGPSGAAGSKLRSVR